MDGLCSLAFPPVSAAMRPPQARPDPPEFERFSTPSPPRLGEVAISRTYEAGFELERQGDPALCVFLVESGLVKLLIGHADGRQERIVTLRSSGWVLGADAVVAHQPYAATAVTIHPSGVGKIAADEFLRLMETDRALAKHIHEMHAREVIAGQAQLGDESTPVKVRLLQFLADLASATTSGPGSDELRVKVPLKQWEIAQLLGVAPPYLNKLIKEIEGEGLISRQRRGIVVHLAKLDLRRLELNY